jgi:hypothetical protein
MQNFLDVRGTAKPQKQEAEPVTVRQKGYLQSKGVSTNKMTKRQAIPLIGRMRQQEQKEKLAKQNRLKRQAQLQEQFRLKRERQLQEQQGRS